MADFVEGWSAFWRYAIDGPVLRWCGFWLALGVVMILGAMLRLVVTGFWKAVQ